MSDPTQEQPMVETLVPEGMWGAVQDMIAGPEVAAVMRQRAEELAAARHVEALEKIARRRAVADDWARHRASMRLFAEQRAAADAEAACARARQLDQFNRWIPVVLGLVCGLIAALGFAVLILVGVV